MKRHLQVDDKIVRVVIHNQQMIRTIYLDTISILRQMGVVVSLFFVFEFKLFV